MEADIHEQFREAVSSLERIATMPTEVATVVEVEGEYVKASTSRGSISLKKPTASIKLGDTILVNAESKQYIEHSPYKTNPGLITYVQDVHGDMAVVEVNGVKKLIPVIVPVEAGDKVRLDEYGVVVREVVPPPPDQKLDTGVIWDDIGGNHEAKQALIESIENPYKHPELYAHYGAKPAAGVLMTGPPGCGKTMLAKAAATSIGSVQGFIACSGPEVLDPYVGVAEATVRGLFTRARAFHARTGRRAIIFIDEGEALLGDRTARHAYMEKTIVPSFIAQMDGLEESCATVIIATNLGMNLDPAVVRPGRIDHKVEVRRPGVTDTKEIFVKHLRKAPCVGDLDELAEQTTVATWGMAFVNSGQQHRVADHVSGALIAGVVAGAKEAAMRRDLAENTLSGITLRDLAYGLAREVKGMTLTALSQQGS